MSRLATGNNPFSTYTGNQQSVCSAGPCTNPPRFHQVPASNVSRTFLPNTAQPPGSFQPYGHVTTPTFTGPNNATVPHNPNIGLGVLQNSHAPMSVQHQQVRVPFPHAGMQQHAPPILNAPSPSLNVVNHAHAPPYNNFTCRKPPNVPMQNYSTSVAFPQNSYAVNPQHAVGNVTSNMGFGHNVGFDSHAGQTQLPYQYSPVSCPSHNTSLQPILSTSQNVSFLPNQTVIPMLANSQVLPVQSASPIQNQPSNSSTNPSCSFPEQFNIHVAQACKSSVAMNFMPLDKSGAIQNFGTVANSMTPVFQQQTFPFQLMRPSNILSSYAQNIPFTTETIDVEERQLSKLLGKFQKKLVQTENKSSTVAISEYRSLIENAFLLLNELKTCYEELEASLHEDAEVWDNKTNHINELKAQVNQICLELHDPSKLSFFLKKLQRTKKRRERLKRKKLNYSCLKKKKEQDRAELHREIDKFHDVLREKELQAKREEEMKNEADYILAEVRKKIYEAKRTIEKLKIFEKLRQARQENAVKKAMFIHSKHDRTFENKLAELREAMLKQLKDYEAEERALKVMLETEQEGQREEEAQWKIKKMKQIQEKKHANILSCLFGDSEPPLPNMPLFLFWQYYDAGNNSIDSLVKIRQSWDVHLASSDRLDASYVPQKWVSPDQPSSKMWATALEER